jgi:hypothetical protein
MGEQAKPLILNTATEADHFQSRLRLPFTTKTTQGSNGSQRENILMPPQVLW